MSWREGFTDGRDSQAGGIHMREGFTGGRDSQAGGIHGIHRRGAVVARRDPNTQFPSDARSGATAGSLAGRRKAGIQCESLSAPT